MKNIEFDAKWKPDGFQYKAARRPRKQVPSWAESEKKLDEKMADVMRVTRRICYLYFLVGYSSRETADQINEEFSTDYSPNAIKKTIQRLRAL